MKTDTCTQCPGSCSKQTETHFMKSTSMNRTNGMKVISSKISRISESCQREPFASVESIDFTKSARRKCCLGSKISPNFNSANVQALLNPSQSEDNGDARKKTACQTEGKYVRKCMTFTPGDETKITKYKPEVQDSLSQKSQSATDIGVAPTANDPEVIKTVEEIEIPKKEIPNTDQQSAPYSNLLNMANYYNNNYGMASNQFSPYQAYRSNIQNLYNYYQGYRHNLNRCQNHMNPWNRNGFAMNNYQTPNYQQQQQSLVKYPENQNQVPGVPGSVTNESNSLPQTVNGKQLVRKRITTEAFYE